MTPEQEEIAKRLLLERVSYDPETGLFFDKKTGKIKYLDPVGKPRRALRVRFQSGAATIRIPAQNAAWFLHYGEWPSHLVDHKDGDWQNNKIENLRKATKEQNGWNRRTVAGAKSEHKNVCFDGTRQGRKKYKVRVQANGTRRIIGWYATEEEAAQAAREAMEVLHGEFALHNRK